MSVSKTLLALQNNISNVIIGKDESIALLVVSLLAGGHVLLEDVPGLGKTLLARTLAQSIAGRFKRVQCTPDLLPSDVTGVSIFNEKSREFEFKSGPVFSNILLVDEINRTTPRTQSSLLEAMAEHQVSVDGKTYRLPKPFMVIATQNPIENHGTYPLPEAQLDRFLMKISMGYPSLEDEVTIMEKQKTADPLSSLQAVINPETIVKLQTLTRNVHIDLNVTKYIASIIHATREHKSLSFGASPRGSLALMRAAQAMALLKGQDFVDPQLVKDIAKPILAHRIAVKPQHLSSQSAESIVDEILEKVMVPVGSQSVNSPDDLGARGGNQPAPAQAPTQVKSAPVKQAPAPAPKKPVKTTDTGLEIMDI